MPKSQFHTKPNSNCQKHYLQVVFHLEPGDPEQPAKIGSSSEQQAFEEQEVAAMGPTGLLVAHLAEEPYGAHDPAQSHSATANSEVAIGIAAPP